MSEKVDARRVWPYLIAVIAGPSVTVRVDLPATEWCDAAAGFVKNAHSCGDRKTSVKS